MTGVIFGRNPDELNGDIHLWTSNTDETQSACNEHTYEVLEVDNSAIKVDFDTQQKILRVIQADSLTKPLESYCDDCLENSTKVEM